jgi:hypothetical protein
MTQTKLAPAQAYIEQLRQFDDEDLSEEAYYLAAAFAEPPLREDAGALTRYRRMLLVSGEQTRRGGIAPDAVDPGPDEWTLPSTGERTGERAQVQG